MSYEAEFGNGCCHLLWFLSFLFFEMNSNSFCFPLNKLMIGNSDLIHQGDISHTLFHERIVSTILKDMFWQNFKVIILEFNDLVMCKRKTPNKNKQVEINSLIFFI